MTGSPTLAEIVTRRHSTRMFLPDRPVPIELLNECLALAMKAPSNSNVQPWRLFLATGARRDKLAAALAAEARAHPPVTMGLPDSFLPLRRELGALVYGSMGIARDDAEGRWTARLRNFEFFYPPVAGVVCMHRDLGPADAVAVGMFVQTLLLALTERGLDSCVQVSTTLYPDLVREQLDIPEELDLLCGLCIGYADPAFPANSLTIPRNDVAQNVVLVD
ncbi:nitroreductase [Mycolicibacterium chubuense NBB4]|uniref:Nitroreductase n=1 Tax=Mycolicibacterium chubuense (strain NBB4) TaxID=710421 RepID=I4BRI6_MYCCN|nr:nitroreductase [Mycolicibacterium chubuense]AFM19893.1 nitroreductase [Mycolicibacterium chubuense NBB4]